jgi:hypothetical protein
MPHLDNWSFANCYDICSIFRNRKGWQRIAVLTFSPLH